MPIFRLQFFAVEGGPGAPPRRREVAVFQLDEFDAKAAIKRALSEYGLGPRHARQLAELRDEQGEVVMAWPATGEGGSGDARPLA